MEKFGRELVLQRISAYFDKNGYAFKEVSDARGYIDILLLYNKVEIVVETKLSNNYKGTSQLERYLENKPDRRIGYFLIFDITPERKFEKFCDVANNNLCKTKKLYLINIWINPSQPSTGKH